MVASPQAQRVLTGPDERLRTVAAALRGVAHPNVVNVLEVRDDDGTVVVVTELPPGATIAAWLEQQPRTIPEVLGVFLRVVRGLSAIHKAGVAHRSLGADCVRVLGEGQPVPRIDDAVKGEPWTEEGSNDDLVALGRLLRGMVGTGDLPRAVERLVASLAAGDPALATADRVLEHLHTDPELAALLPPSARRTRLHRSGPTLLPTRSMQESEEPPVAPARRAWSPIAALVVFGTATVGVAGAVIAAPILAVVAIVLLT